MRNKLQDVTIDCAGWLTIRCCRQSIHYCSKQVHDHFIDTPRRSPTWRLLRFNMAIRRHKCSLASSRRLGIWQCFWELSRNLRIHGGLSKRRCARPQLRGRRRLRYLRKVVSIGNQPGDACQLSGCLAKMPGFMARNLECWIRIKSVATQGKQAVRNARATNHHA